MVRAGLGAPLWFSSISPDPTPPPPAPGSSIPSFHAHPPHGCPRLAHLCSPLPIYPLPPGFLPVCSLGPGQVGHLNLGQDVSSLRFFAICGLQEGFEPFAINMQRPVTTWFSKGLPQFEAVPPEHPHYEVRTNPTQHPQICFHTSFSPQFSSPSYSLSSVNVRPQT